MRRGEVILETVTLFVQKTLDERVTIYFSAPCIQSHYICCFAYIYSKRGKKNYTFCKLLSHPAKTQRLVKAGETGKK